MILISKILNYVLEVKLI